MTSGIDTDNDENRKNKLLEYLTSKIIEKLKAIPGNNAPEDLNLDGSVWEETAYQMHMVRVVYGIFMKILLVKNVKMPIMLLMLTKDIMIKEYVYYDEDDTKEEIRSQEDDAFSDVLKEIEETVLNLAADYEINVSEQYLIKGVMTISHYSFY